MDLQLQAARRQAETRIVRELARTLALIDKAKSELERRLDLGDAEVKVSDLWNLIRAEQLLIGEATDRIEVREVRLVLSAAFSVAVRYVEPGRQREFLEELKGATAGLLELGPADAELEAGGDS